MEIFLELIGKFLWDLLKDAVMLFIITKMKAKMRKIWNERFQ